MKEITPKQKTAIKTFLAALAGLVGAFAEKYAGVASWIVELVGGFF